MTEERQPNLKTVSQIPKRSRGEWITKDAVFDCSLRKLREQHRITLRDVARHTGVSVATIARIEWGSECQLTAVLKLAHFYELPVEKIWKWRKP